MSDNDRNPFTLSPPESLAPSMVPDFEINKAMPTLGRSSSSSQGMPLLFLPSSFM